MLVEFWADSYAPGMIQGRIVNRRTLARVVRHLEAHGQGDEDTFLISPEDCALLLGPQTLQDIEDFGARIRVDDFTALTFYGHDCNTLI